MIERKKKRRSSFPFEWEKNSNSTKSWTDVVVSWKSSINHLLHCYWLLIKIKKKFYILYENHLKIQKILILYSISSSVLCRKKFTALTKQYHRRYIIKYIHHQLAISQPYRYIPVISCDDQSILKQHVQICKQPASKRNKIEFFHIFFILIKMRKKFNIILNVTQAKSLKYKNIPLISYPFFYFSLE